MIVNVHVTVSTLYRFICIILPIENVGQNVCFYVSGFLETPVLVKRNNLFKHLINDNLKKKL